MQPMLLAAAAAIAALAVPATPADAQSWGGHGSGATAGGNHARGGGKHHRVDRNRGLGVFRDSNDFGDLRRFRDDELIAPWGWSGEYNRSWDPESFNDWWHERPWRSYPRWVNSDSCDRMWWGGGRWRCSWWPWC